MGRGVGCNVGLLVGGSVGFGSGGCVGCEVVGPAGSSVGCGFGDGVGRKVVGVLGDSVGGAVGFAGVCLLSIAKENSADPASSSLFTITLPL